MWIWQIWKNEFEPGIDFFNYYGSHCFSRRRIIIYASKIIYMFMMFDICSFISYVYLTY